MKMVKDDFYGCFMEWISYDIRWPRFQWTDFDMIIIRYDYDSAYVL